VCAHAGAAATIVEDGPGPTRTRWTLNLGSWDENLVDAVDESYSLNVTGSRVEVAAATVWGARHALDSLAQLARTQPDGGVSLSHASVTDEPEYEYRGLMVSPGQRFMTPELLKTTLDAMEIARMNVLHFHLSEFCRYAIESKAFPQLSANLSSGLNKGFYTFDEIHTLVAQAKERGIRVIPEYDIPGHQARNMGVPTNKSV
jgi:hexosaminidase